MSRPTLDLRWMLLVLAYAAPGAWAENLPMESTSSITVLLAAELETTLSSQMNGVLAELNVSFGEHVAKSTPMARFNCNEAEARSKVTMAELSMAKLNLEAKKNLRQLNAVGNIEVSMANTEVQKAEGARTIGAAQSSYCQVLAPFSGHVTKVYVKPYQTVTADTPLFDLVGDGALKVRLNVPSNQLQLLKPGIPLQVSIRETGKTYPAHVSVINSRVDAVSQTVELEARFDEKFTDLMAGMSGTARFHHDNE